MSLFSVFHFFLPVIYSWKPFLTPKTICCSLVFNCLTIASTPTTSESCIPEALWAPTHTLLPSKCSADHGLEQGHSSNKYLLFVEVHFVDSPALLPKGSVSTCSPKHLTGASLAQLLVKSQKNFLPEQAAWDGQADAKRFPSYVLTINGLIKMVWRKGTLLKSLMDILEYKRHCFYQEPLPLYSLKFLTSKPSISPFLHPEAYCFYLLRVTHLYTI